MPRARLRKMQADLLSTHNLTQENKTMAVKYYASDFDRREDQYFNNSPDIGMTKEDVKQWIEYIMKEENETTP